MKVLCFGSLNIDYTYRVPHFVQKGETLAAEEMNVFCGGKGFNQAVAFARAGAETYHAGAIGKDGLFLLDSLKNAGVHTELVAVLEDRKTGCAIIQNDHSGDNCIMLYGGTNRTITREMADRVLEKFGQDDVLVLQNEINEIPYIMEKAHERGMKIVLNPSPMDGAIAAFPLETVDYFFLNQVEACQLLGSENREEPEKQLDALRKRFPAAAIVLTLGEKGSLYADQAQKHFQPAFRVKAVDTTAAGDTFTGFLRGGLRAGRTVPEAMELAAKASAIAVTRPGASPSIPTLEEVLNWKGQD